MKKTIALYAISANPPTWGHADIMMRAAQKFDELYWVYATNPNKQALFSDEERVEMMQIYVNYYGLSNVIIDKAEGAVVRYAKNIKADCLIRGLRSSSDYQYEYELSIGNRGIAKEIETFCMFTKPHYATISSSIVRELASLNEEIKQYVHKDVKNIIMKKFN